MAKIVTGISPFEQRAMKAQVTLLRRTNGQWMGYEKRNLLSTLNVPIAERVHEHPEVLLIMGSHEEHTLHKIVGRRDFSVTVIDEKNARELPFKFPRPMAFSELPMM